VRKIVLAGFRGTGKTSVGQILAERLGVSFFDADALIERRAGMTIPEIFSRRGEAGFRDLERGVIASLRDANGVISTGGGAVCNPENVADLRWRGTVILLTAPPDVILERITGSDRPELTDLRRQRRFEPSLNGGGRHTWARPMPVSIPGGARRRRSQT